MDRSHFDPLPEIVEIVRDAIADGLLNEDPDTFEERLHELHGAELEAYLQDLWDNI